jgi:transposase InsO family protein
MNLVRGLFHSYVRKWSVRLEKAFGRQAAAPGIKEVTTAPGSPWQNPYVERLIGLMRRECLDYMIIMGTCHIKCIPSSYVEYFHSARTHLSLGKDAPERRKGQPI